MPNNSKRSRRPVMPEPSEPSSPLTPVPGFHDATSAPSPATPIIKTRIGIPLTADESAIDWMSMRDATRGKLLEMLRKDPKVATATAGATSPAPDIFSDAWCGVIFDALGKLEASIVQRVYGATPEQAAVMLFNEPEKAMLSEPFRKVLNKYAGSWLTSYQDEAALLLAFGGIHFAKLQALRAAIEQPRPQPAPVVTMHDRKG